MKDYQLGKDDNGSLVADSYSILNRQENYL
jgi:hypothetical protein